MNTDNHDKKPDGEYCPLCGSSLVERDKFADVGAMSTLTVGTGATTWAWLSIAAAGLPAVSMLVLIAGTIATFGATQKITEIPVKYRCNHCDHTWKE
jgi:hypothetical protein